MAHYARINALTHKVDQVIVAEPEFISKLPDRDFWIKTSYNMRGGVYYDPETNQPADDQSVIDGDEARERKNYAGIGYTYCTERDAFIPPQPYPSWTVNEDTCLWEAPVPMPDDGKPYQWNEQTQSWDEVADEQFSG